VETILITEGERVASEIVIGRGTLPSLADYLPERSGRSRVAILTQPAVAASSRDVAVAFEASGIDVHTIELPVGERAKTLSVVEDVARELNAFGMHRADTVVGIGGGVVTDVAGFVAATYLRGVECVVAATTLLGAVDAAIGGKTGVNVGGKNLVGVFKHPARVIIDLDVLDRLPDDLLRQGTAEAVKTGFVGDPELVDLYRRYGTGAPLDEVVPRAARVKASIVSRDFREGGVRAVLNYGHTIGHGVEVAGAISHGDAVAIGMVAAGVIGERTVGFAGADEQRALIHSLGLPTSAPGLDPEEVIRLMDLDKKRDAGGLRFVVLERIGTPTVVRPDTATVRAALHAIGID
jgi:3-dehydroquinate synthase